MGGGAGRGPGPVCVPLVIVQWGWLSWCLFTMALPYASGFAVCTGTCVRCVHVWLAACPWALTHPSSGCSLSAGLSFCLPAGLAAGASHLSSGSSCLHPAPPIVKPAVRGLASAGATVSGPGPVCSSRRARLELGWNGVGTGPGDLASPLDPKVTAPVLSLAGGLRAGQAHFKGHLCSERGD